MESSPDVEAQRAAEAPNLRRTRTRSSSNSGYRAATTYNDTSAAYWELYMSEADNKDKKFVDNLNGDTNSRVVMISLFSTVVASFIIEIYKTLLPDNSQRTVDLLSQLVLNSNSSSPPSSPSPVLDNLPFTPPTIAIRINIALFLSLFLSVMSAMACTLNQQWCRDYLNYAYPRATPQERGRIRTYLFQGVEQFKLRFMYATDVLLHASIFLFFGALSDFFYTVHPQLGAVSRYCLITSAVVYTALSISPLMFGNSPYNTPLTPLLRTSGLLVLYGSRITLRCLRRDRFSPIKRYPYFKGFRFDKLHFLLFESRRRAASLEPYAMKWLFTQSDFPESQVDKLLDALPGYLSSHHTKGDQLDTYLVDNYILKRIKDHFMTCATSPELSEEARISRVIRCGGSLRLIFKYCIPMPRADQVPSERDKEKLQLQRRFNQELVDDFGTQCDYGMVGPIVALRASCIRGLAVQDLLTQINQSDEETPFNRPFSMVIIPFYTFFFGGDNKGIIHRLHSCDTLNPDENRGLWKDLLYDGPLVNLTILAEVVRSAESAPSSSLPFCWKVLDILLSQLRIAGTEVSQFTLDRFNAVHKRTRNYVRGNEKGFRITRLLEILDAVSRGLRLSMAFSGHRQYHSRADLVFGEEHLWNRDLLEAFAHCLPDYIAKIPHDEGREFMEGMVCDDDLWTSLQVNLWNARRSDGPTPDQFRVFEDCCTVLDVAFSALEDSSKVDWRAPEFGLLAQNFESFITHYSQGAFMATTTMFRVNTVKARICKALVSQFRDDLDREGTLFFRSEWDTASLAMVLRILNIGYEEDAEIWRSHTNEGHASPEVTQTYLGIIDAAARDGPLLIFCKLGHLLTTAVPLYSSGLERKDLESVFELQRNIVEDQRHPLNRASEEVWGELVRLRDQVGNIYGRSTGEDRDHLRHLLEIIDDVRNSHPPAPGT